MTTVADYIAEFVYKNGVRNVFMLSGTGSIYLDDAFAQHKGMQHICARHEAAAVIMAKASARLTRSIGVVIATTGPGGTNAIGGVAEAWVDSDPILVISGQVYTKQISKGVRTFGVQGFNIIENVQNITNYAVQVSDPQKIRFHMENALYKATKGRPGPVWIDIPFDIQSAVISPDKLVGFTPDFSVVNLKRDKVGLVIDALHNSTKPLIVFGQGIRNADAIQEFKKMVGKLKIPSIAARMGLDILPYSNPYFFGLGGMRGQKLPAQMIKECDCIIAIGTSFTHAFAGQNYDQFNPSAKLIMVNIDLSEMTKPGLNIDLAIEMDANEFISILLHDASFQTTNSNHSDWLKRCIESKKNLPNVVQSCGGNPINSYYFVECLNRYSKDNHIFVNDAGSANYVCSQSLKLREGQRELTSGAFYSMGVALPLAIGASAAEPDCQVVVVTGDGSIELNIQELKTMSDNKLNIKLFVINNGGYASIRKSQDDMVGGRYTDDQKVLNFSKVSEAFELPFHQIDDFAKLDVRIPEILSSNGPELIEVVCDPNQKLMELFKG